MGRPIRQTADLSIVELVLATWRLSCLLVQERGPGDVFKRIREMPGVETHALGPDGWPMTFFGRLLFCIRCTSVWAALAVLILSQLAPWLVRVLAFSAGAIIIEELGFEGLKEADHGTI